MRFQRNGDRVLLELDHSESERLGIALAAGYDSVSQSEYFVRTGLAESTIREVAALLLEQQPADRTVVLPIEDGVEAEENPRRPRPGH